MYLIISHFHVHVVMKPNHFLCLVPPFTAIRDIMTLSPWRSLRDGPSLANVKQCQEFLSLFLSVDLRAAESKSRWTTPKQPDFVKTDSRVFSTMSFIRNNVNAKRQNLHTHQLSNFVLALSLLIEDHYLNKKEHYLL